MIRSWEWKLFSEKFLEMTFLFLLILESITRSHVMFMNCSTEGKQSVEVLYIFLLLFQLHLHLKIQMVGRQVVNGSQ